MARYPKNPKKPYGSGRLLQVSKRKISMESRIKVKSKYYACSACAISYIQLSSCFCIGLTDSIIIRAWWTNAVSEL
jgi:hypothetical protein